MILFDTNILVYVHNVESPNHQIAYQLESQVIKEKLEAAVSSQNLTELYATITNPSKISKPVIPAEAKRIINDYLNSSFQIIYPKEDDLKLALSLVSDKKVVGRKIFDVYLVATMLSNSINTIYTNNDKDFQIFDNIKVVNPFK